MAITYLKTSTTAIEQAHLEQYVCRAWSKMQKTKNVDQFTSWARGFARYKPAHNKSVRCELAHLIMLARYL